MDSSESGTSDEEIRTQQSVKKPYKCTELNCNAAFSRPSRLQDHQMRHSGKQPYQCDHPNCCKAYSTQSHLNRHKKVSHSMSEPKEIYICKETACGKCFANKYSLKKHTKRFHCEDNLPFSCTECDKKFKRKSLLHNHLLEHGKDPPYKCNICSLGFVMYHLYQKHLKNHKTYECDCKKIFNRWTELCAHKRNECSVKQKGHKCIICGKVFPRKQILSEHALVHVQDSQQHTYKCYYLDCNRTYKYNKNLQFHIKTFHQKITDSVECPKRNCKKIFKSRKNLKNHLRTCHSGLPPKERKIRRPRKDKGTIKRNLAAEMSGFSKNDSKKIRKQDNSELEKNTDLLKNVIEEKSCQNETEINISKTNKKIVSGLPLKERKIRRSRKGKDVIDKKIDESVVNISSKKIISDSSIESEVSQQQNVSNNTDDSNIENVISEDPITSSNDNSLKGMLPVKKRPYEENQGNGEINGDTIGQGAKKSDTSTESPDDALRHKERLDEDIPNNVTMHENIELDSNIKINNNTDNNDIFIDSNIESGISEEQITSSNDNSSKGMLPVKKRPYEENQGNGEINGDTIGYVAKKPNTSTESLDDALRHKERLDEDMPNNVAMHENIEIDSNIKINNNTNDKDILIDINKENGISEQQITSSNDSSAKGMLPVKKRPYEENQGNEEINGDAIQNHVPKRPNTSTESPEDALKCKERLDEDIHDVAMHENIEVDSNIKIVKITEANKHSMDVEQEGVMVIDFPELVTVSAK